MEGGNLRVGLQVRVAPIKRPGACVLKSHARGSISGLAKQQPNSLLPSHPTTNNMAKRSDHGRIIIIIIINEENQGNDI